jgi:hypothetical protein
MMSSSTVFRRDTKPGPTLVILSSVATQSSDEVNQEAFWVTPPHPKRSTREWIIVGIGWVVAVIVGVVVALMPMFLFGMVFNPILARGYRLRALWLVVFAIPLWVILKTRRNYTRGKAARCGSTVPTLAIQAVVLISSLALTVGATTKPPPLAGLHRYAFASPFRALVILGFLSLASTLVTRAPVGRGPLAMVGRVLGATAIVAFMLPLTSMQSCLDPVYTEVTHPLPPGLVVVSNRKTVEGRSTGTTASRTVIGRGKVSGSELVKLVADHYRSVGWPIEVYSDDYAAGVLDEWHLDIWLSKELDPKLDEETVTLIWDRQRFPWLCE